MIVSFCARANATPAFEYPVVFAREVFAPESRVLVDVLARRDLFFLLWTMRCLRLAITRQLRPAVTGLIAGIALLDAAFIIVHTGQLALGAIAVGCFLLTNLLQRKIAGT